MSRLIIAGYRRAEPACRHGTRLRACLLVQAALWLALVLAPSPAEALEPVTVDVQGTVELSDKNAGNARELALHAALVEAAFEVARRFVPPAVMEFEQERIRETLAAGAAGFILTYRVDGPVGTRPAADDPEKKEFVLGLSATLDAARVRERLQKLGVLRERRERASLVLRVSLNASGPGRVPALPSAFAHYLTRRLEAAGLVVVDPALRAAGSLGAGDAFELARSLGTDLAIEVGIRWQEHPATSLVAGGRAAVRVLALRTDDGSEVALARFAAPAYHDDPDEAFARALEALQAQVADNLTLQLERNWQALAKERGPVELRLLNATSLVQVDAVQETLRSALGADEATLVTLGPWVAEILVTGPLSPGALQDRLVGAAFDGFRLQPVEVSRQLVEVRVETLAEPAARPAPPPVGGP